MIAGNKGTQWIQCGTHTSQAGEEAICMESLEDFLDMLLVGGHVCRVDEDVIQVYYYANI